eukprot:s2609_g5.t1
MCRWRSFADIAVHDVHYSTASFGLLQGGSEVQLQVAPVAADDRRSSARCLLSQVYARVCKKSTEAESTGSQLYVLRLVESVCRRATPDARLEQEAHVDAQLRADESPQQLTEIRRDTVSSMMERAVAEVAPDFCGATPAASIVATEASFGERGCSPLGWPANSTSSRDVQDGAPVVFRAAVAGGYQQKPEAFTCAGHSPSTGYDALRSAVQHGQKDIVSLLLASKAQPDSSSLTTAARFGHHEAFRSVIR